MQTGQLASSRSRAFAALRWIVIVLATPIALLLALVGLYLTYVSFIPAYSAEHRVDQIATTVRLDFYLVWDENHDNGRYLTVSRPGGRLSLSMCGYDWAHNSRTNIYLTPNVGLAVLGPDECNYMIAAKSFRVTADFDLPSERWSYLGAFDFLGLGAERHLRFAPAAEEPECLPHFKWPEHSGVVEGLRNGARRDRCPPLISHTP